MLLTPTHVLITHEPVSIGGSTSKNGILKLYYERHMHWKKNDKNKPNNKLSISITTCWKRFTNSMVMNHNKFMQRTKLELMETE